MIAGQEYWISAWLNKAKNSGQTYMKLKFAVKEEEETPSSIDDFDDSDVPF